MALVDRWALWLMMSLTFTVSMTIAMPGDFVFGLVQLVVRIELLEMVPQKFGLLSHSYPIISTHRSHES